MLVRVHLNVARHRSRWRRWLVTVLWWLLFLLAVMLLMAVANCGYCLPSSCCRVDGDVNGDEIRVCPHRKARRRWAR